MSILSTLDFEAGSLPAGVTEVKTGTGSAVISAGGLVGNSTQKGRVTVPGSSTARFNLDLSAMSGSSIGTTRSFGGYFKYVAVGGGDVRLFRVLGNAGAQFLAGCTRTSGTWQFFYQNNSGTQTINFPTGINPADGIGHKIHLGVVCSSSANSSYAYLYFDDVLILGQHFNGSTVTFGTGVSHFYLGDITGSSTSTVDWDGVYVSDSLTPEVSSEGGLAGYSGAIAANANTVTLSTTGTSPTWYSSDPDVMTVSSGVVTLQHASGGIAVIGDSLGSTQVVEFLARTLTWSVGGYTQTGSGVGSTLSVPITLSAVSDGVTSYADIWASIVGASSVKLTALTGTMPNLTATFVVTGTAPFTAYVNGSLVTLSPVSSVTLPQLERGIRGLNRGLLRGLRK